jgi:hypothetical protein
VSEPVRSEDPPIAFKVPVALADDGRLVKRADAIKGERYRCPACETDLVFKAGAIRARHFAHAPTYACHPETVLHETAKRLIAQVVTDWTKGTGPCPTVRKRCKLCYRDYDEPLRGRIDEASVEYRLSDGLVADIALLRGQNVVAVVEILVSHAVDGDKAARLTVPWLELRGVDIVADPVSWKPVASGSVRPVLCKRCVTRDRSAADLCRALGIEYDPMRYLAAVYACYRCQKKTPVFAWTRGQHHEVRKPPQPQPRTIQWRYTRTVGHRYWANTCAHCGWGFGDWHLFMQPDGPFFGRPELQDDGTNNVDLELAPVIERIAPRRAAAPASPYEVDVVRCRECRAETRYFTWDGDEPPDPRPETVRLVGSPPRSASSPGLLPVILPASPGSWQNHCLHCDASLER